MMSVICVIQSLSSFVPRLSVNLPSGFSTMRARVYLEKPVPAWRLISRGRQAAIEQPSHHCRSQQTLHDCISASRCTEDAISASHGSFVTRRSELAFFV